MKDISYEILDLFRQYGSSPEGIRQRLDSGRPEVLYALSDIRQNLLEWLDYTGCGEVLQIGSGYGVLTGLLAQVRPCDSRWTKQMKSGCKSGAQQDSTPISHMAIRQGLRQDSRI